MKDDIETLRGALGWLNEEEGKIEALASLDRIHARIAELEKEATRLAGNVSGYNSVVVKRTAERESLRKALDDRFAADQRAAKAIFAETGRTAGFPSVKEVVAYYIAENERLEKESENDRACIKLLTHGLNERNAERDSLRAIVSKCADALGNGAAISHDCSIAFMGELPSEIGLHVASLTEDRDTWKEQAGSLRAKLERAKEALGNSSREMRMMVNYIRGHKQPMSWAPDSGILTDMWATHQACEAVIAELSADAPAQKTQHETSAIDWKAQAEKLIEALVKIRGMCGAPSSYLIEGFANAMIANFERAKGNGDG